MALKQDRLIVQTEINSICNDVSVKGQIPVYGTAGSGSAVPDYKAGTVSIASNPSGFIPAGLLLANFVNIDTTRQHRNFHKDEQLIGEKAPLLTQGWVSTNQFVGTPTLGQTAYLSSSGFVTPTVHATGGTVATPKVGQFQSIVDEDGYIKLAVHLPVV